MDRKLTIFPSAFRDDLSATGVCDRCLNILPILFRVALFSFLASCLTVSVLDLRCTNSGDSSLSFIPDFPSSEPDEIEFGNEVIGTFKLFIIFH